MTRSKKKDEENNPGGVGGKLQNLLTRSIQFLASRYEFKDPNSEIEEERWKLIKHRIESKGGVVAAQHVAPFLDPPPQRTHDEAHMFPVLIRFEGRPVIDESGRILYHFKTLKGANGGGRWGAEDGYFLEEKKWKVGSLSDLCLMVADFVVLGQAMRVVYDLLQYRSGRFVKFYTAKISMIPLLRITQLLLSSGLAIESFQFLFCWIFPIIKNVGVYKRNRARQQAALALQYSTKKKAATPHFMNRVL